MSFAEDMGYDGFDPDDMTRYAGYAFWTIVALVDTTVLLALFGPVSVQKWFVNAICSVL